MLQSWNMKKFLAIIVLSLFWLNSANADCTTDIKGEWDYNDKKTYVIYKFVSSSDKWIKIIRVGLWTATKQKVIEKTVDIYVKPFGIASTRFYVGDLNLAVVKSGFRSCRYEEPSKSELKKKPLTLKELQNKNKKSGAQKWLDKIRGN